MTFAFFQALGTLPLSINFLYTHYNGKFNISAFSTSNLETIPSSPGALLICNLLSLFDIISLVSSMLLNLRLLSSLIIHFTSGSLFAEFSVVKSEPNYSISKLPISSFSDTNCP